MKKKTKYSGVLALIIIAISFLYTNYGEDILNNNSNNITKRVISEEKVSNSDFSIQYIDVGQADSILIESNNKYMLIDAGNNEDGKKLVTYFKNIGITKFDYVIGTHAHEDHIGGMDDVINNFDIDTFFMPDAITTTRTFEDVLDALENKGIAFETPNIFDKFNIGGASFEVLYTGTDTSDLNNTSIVIRMVYKSRSFLFMGDATSKVEAKILNKNIESDVLKVGHHGSQYSTSESFLEKVNPSYAVISVGNNNTYGHPKDITLKKLENSNIKVYRTDKSSTIILNSDGENINFEFKNTDTNG